MAQIKTLLVIKLYVISKNIFIYKNISRYIFQNDFVNQMVKKLEDLTFIISLIVYTTLKQNTSTEKTLVFVKDGLK